MKLDFTDAAVSDLQSIRNYTLETWGEDKESLYLEALWEKFETILDSSSTMAVSKRPFSQLSNCSPG